MKLIKLFFLLISVTLSAQEVPRIKLQDSTFLALKKLEVKTEVVGNIATTTYTMRFYNGTDRVLEGELAFPLGQGQSVTNFAMDVNGKMRDAVIVEKELGRVAYESTIRQTIDPGLLEMTKGNNYKARVYPIPANGYKMLSITFEQEMIASNGKHRYTIPFNFQEPLDFSLDVLVYNVAQDPKVISDNPYKLKFKTNDGILKASVRDAKALVNTAVVLEFPVGNTENVTTYDNYFNVYKLFKPQTRIKQKPKTISLYWDTSFSMKFRKLESEMKLLEAYFDYLDTVQVDFIAFNNATDKTKRFNITNGNWKLLKKEIESLVYDGGTSYLDLENTSSDEILFFSDGMFNLGELQNGFKGGMYTINAVSSANHQFLEYISNQNNGQYINLNFTETKEALHTLKTETFKFLGIDNNRAISEVYPLVNTAITSDFSISGKFDTNTTLQLNFGYGNEVTEHVEVNLVKSSFNSLVKRLWAKKKLQALHSNKEENKAEIISLAKKNHLISEYTSLIILDRIEDYVRYKIEPPAELKSEFKERMANNANEETDRLEDIEDRRNQLFEDYLDLKSWYATSYPILTKTKKPQPIIDPVTPPVVQPTTTVPEPEEATINRSQTEEANDIIVENQIDSNKRIVSGLILDDNGLPLPGATLILKGTSNGASTDFDGKYAINAEVGDIIMVDYVGFYDKEITVGDSNSINTILEPSEDLDEVVITAYGTQRKASISYSVQTIESESIESKSMSDAVRTLSGSVSGVAITNASGEVGASPVITIRGASTVTNNTTPLYVIDGVVVSDDAFKAVATDTIDSLTVLKAASATSLYGSRGANGVLVITTKEGLKNNAEEINALNDKIKDDINFKPWSSDSDYIKILQAQTTPKAAYDKYLELRIKYRNTPSFFIDVADYFDAIQEKELAITVVSNLTEIDLDNHEVMRALAYKLEYFQQYDLALHVYKEILKLRPEEPQSTRDLALAYESVGNYQKAFDLLYTIIDGQLVEKDLNKRFYGIEHLAFIEASHLLQTHKKEIKLNDTQKQLLKPIKLDLRVVADWNHNDTDLDLWVETPKNKSISYKNNRSDYGDRLSEDMTDGYGPEEFMIKKGLKGDYEIELDYFADAVQKISGPTILKITIFKNYGSKNETKEVRIYRLDSKKDVLEIGSISF
ncbi:VIT domain-containing protein [Olleya sp. Bg11-27]|uniref:VIT domain-containing protein n=1 Tax=Olleya sp. Bg11-27 TaxID=2058135 RepID=UPI000C303C03|nr:VIT domain-containing protein [Olleya sp. Bg11-27]AUC76738.1 hypothetical protein CW732_14060 [Olleya sp. Bg11-27]